jgi:uncharacterized membrane-anchored protein
MSFEPHPLRGAVLSEVHARPFAPVETPCRILHFAFLTDADLADQDRAALLDFLGTRGHRGPEKPARHHRVAFADAALRWEQHAEFTTYTWEFKDLGADLFARPATDLAKSMMLLPQPGPHLVSVDLHLLADQEAKDWRRGFDAASLAAFQTEPSDAIAATDFHVGSDGFVRVLVIDRGMPPLRAGTLIQQLLELETYRSLCLLGLPAAQRLQPVVRTIENALAAITAAMTKSEGLVANRSLLDRLMAIAGELEAGASQTQFRFGATRAYFELVASRLAALQERPVEELQTMATFMNRRLVPAMRTCSAVEERQEALSDKLARAANLLRTRVDIELEQQNSELLKAMNERTRLQLRLQQTVEGLSIAAISYYVVSLLDYAIEPLPLEALGLPPKLIKATLVIVTVAVIAWTVLSLRRRNKE